MKINNTHYVNPNQLQSSFNSCQKDLKEILKKIFVESIPLSTQLKKLFIINSKKCLEADDSLVQDYDLKRLREEGYIKIEPKLQFEEHSEVKSFLIIEFNHFEENATNPYYKDAIIEISVICYTDQWDIGDFQIRPLKIIGYIDSILNGARLSGIGQLNFLSADEMILNEDLSGYMLRYAAVHGVDDTIEDD